LIKKNTNIICLFSGITHLFAADAAGHPEQKSLFCAHMKKTLLGKSVICNIRVDFPNSQPSLQIVTQELFSIKQTTCLQNS